MVMMGFVDEAEIQAAVARETSWIGNILKDY